MGCTGRVWVEAGVRGVCDGMEAMREGCARRGNGGGSPEEEGAHTAGGNGAEG